MMAAVLVRDGCFHLFGTAAILIANLDETRARDKIKVVVAESLGLLNDQLVGQTVGEGELCDQLRIALSKLRRPSEQRARQKLRS